MGYCSTIKNTQQLGWISDAYAKWKKPDFQMLLLSNYIYMLLCKRGNYGVEHSVIPRGETWEEKRKLWGRGNLLRDGLS